MNDLQFHQLFPVSRGEWIMDFPEMPTYCTHSGDVIYVTTDQVLHVFEFRDGKTESYHKYESEMFTPTSELKEYHGRMLTFGTGEKIVVFNRLKESFQSLNVEHVTVGFSDGANFALITKDGEIITYVLQFDGNILQLNNASVYSGCPVHEYINVGWGSETTQFKGKRTLKSDEAQPKDYILDKDPPTIIWSQSNDMFAVNFFNKKVGRRQCKIFTPLCKLLFLGSDVEGLQSQMAWKPPHSVIAFPVANNDGMEIHLYEKLGPIRDMFPLHKSMTVSKMLWSQDGAVLGIMQENREVCTLSIYMLKTGRWYLKQYLHFESPNRLISFSFMASPNDKIYSLCLLTEREVYVYNVFLSVVVSPLKGMEKSITTSAITDGNEVELYIYGYFILPPCLAQCIINLPNPINMIRFHPTESEVLFLDCYGMIYIYRYTGETSTLARQHQLEQHGFPLTIQDMFWQMDGKLECVAFDPVKNVCNLTIVNFGMMETQVEIKEKSEPLWKKKYSQDASYSLMEQHKSLSFELPLGRDFECSYARFPLKEEGIVLQNQPFIFVLVDDNCLYLNQILMSTNVSSFVVHDNYLHFTSSATNVLVTVILNVRTLERIFDQSLLVKDIPGRAIETGALLVTGLHKKAEVVLQLPRGNLETIKVELILINVIENLIVKGDWLGAHDYIRMQKMDSNILADLDMRRFLDNIPEIIESVGSPALINQLVEELSDFSNACNTYRYFREETMHTRPDKVKLIVTTVVHCIARSSSYAEYLLPVMSCCLMFSPEDGLQNSFNHLAVVIEIEGNRPQVIESIVKCVQYLRNKYMENQLFNSSLCTMNMKLAMLTADAINKDPKEYRPILDKLGRMTGPDLRFELYNYIKDYEKALSWLIRIAQADVILNYIAEHDLYDRALDHLPEMRPDMMDAVKMVLGDRCMRRGDYLEAFNLLADIDSKKTDAYYAAKKSNSWRVAIDILTQLNRVDEQQQIQEIAEKLVAANHILEAAFVYQDHLQDYAKATELLLQRGQISYALNSAREYLELPVVEVMFEEAAQNYVDRVRGKIEELNKNFLKHQDRLEEVRANRSISDFVDEEDDSSLYAESSNASSRSSGHSRGSARQRRKLEKKMTSLRKGNQYEDIALVRTLHGIVEELFTVQFDIQELRAVSTQFESRYEGQVKRLAQELYDIQLEVYFKLDSIWDRAEIDKNDNYSYLSPLFLMPPVNVTLKWAKAYEGLVGYIDFNENESEANRNEDDSDSSLSDFEDIDINDDDMEEVFDEIVDDE